MAPRETPKTTPKVQRTIAKNVGTHTKTPTSVLQKTVSTRATATEKKAPLKVNNVPDVPRQRTSTVPGRCVVATTNSKKPNEKQTVPPPGSVTKSAKKATWKRRPKPAHSGVPIPEKMKRLLERQLLQDSVGVSSSDCSL